MTFHHLLPLLGGIVLAGIGGEMFVRGLVGIARCSRISPGIIGATVAAFATSSPELSVAISAASDGHPEISLGDVLGSNVANVALIMALGLVISPIQCTRDSIKRDFPVTLFVPVVIGLFAIDGRLGRAEAVLLLLLFVAWLRAVIRDARHQRASTAAFSERNPVLLSAGASLGGLVCLFAGGRFIVLGAEGLAIAFGIPDFIIGATVVAVGTSVPELAAVVISQVRGQKELSLGVILGSNIFNGLFIVPVAGIICPISTVQSGVLLSLSIGLATVAMVYPPHNGIISRLRGGLLLLIYVAYVVLVFQR